ncbi:MAG TPA: FxLYD domain-containing protein [Candidatus Didemnitutus sp.]|nr:FxLYD domain-containing protein [Candidatus Didemnitutus sp.]
MKYIVLLSALLIVAISFTVQPLVAQDEKAMRKKCTVSVTWSWRGEDATTVVTVKNETKKTLVDPVVRVRFYNKDGAEVSTDAKGYATRIKPGASKRLEARFWSSVDSTAVTAKGEVEYCVFE